MISRCTAASVSVYLSACGQRAGRAQGTRSTMNGQKGSCLLIYFPQRFKRKPFLVMNVQFAHLFLLSFLFIYLFIDLFLLLATVLSQLNFFHRKFGLLFPQGKPAATESRYPTYGARWVFKRFHNPLNSGMDYRIFHVRTIVKACDCTRVCVRIP